MNGGPDCRARQGGPPGRPNGGEHSPTSALSLVIAVVSPHPPARALAFSPLPLRRCGGAWESA